ncbi:hypothetical protein CEF00_13635, partial [Lactobacillus crispatus]
VGIELSGQPTIAPQGGADEPASGQDLSAGEIRGHDVVPVLVAAHHEHDGLVIGEAAQDPERLPGVGLPHIAGRDQQVEGGRLGPELIRIQHRLEVPVGQDPELGQGISRALRGARCARRRSLHRDWA